MCPDKAVRLDSAIGSELNLVVLCPILIRTLPMTTLLTGGTGFVDQPISWRGTGGASDGNKFAAAGLPNIDTLGPRGGNIHSMDEYLIPESLAPSAKLVTLILLSFANEA